MYTTDARKNARNRYLGDSSGASMNTILTRAWLCPLFGYVGPVAAHSLAANDLRPEARLRQRGHDIRHMLGPSRLQHELDLGGEHGQMGERALMMDFLDVGVGAGDASGDLRERPRQIAQ